MCGRFALVSEKHILEALFDLDWREDLIERYNIAPTQNITAVRLSPERGKPETANLRWGLVPFWADDFAVGNKMINARAETVAEKPSFRQAFKKRRLLIPASGFFEWKKPHKQPFYICREDGQPFAFAGLWERWDKGDTPLESCAILTTTPNELIASLHDRMPVIIAPEAFRIWLDPQTPAGRLSELLGPYPSDELTAYPVSRRVNSPGNDDPAIIEELED